MLEINCGNCGSTGKMSLVQERYEGPYRCWKCHSTFMIKTKNDELIACQPISLEEFKRLIAASDT